MRWIIEGGGLGWYGIWERAANSRDTRVDFGGGRVDASRLESFTSTEIPTT